MQPLGVTILAGFLGSGKTTLVNRILGAPGGKRYAVLVNEFGDLGIDGRLIVAADEDLVELANGCVCCTVRGDLERGLLDLLERRGRILGRARFDGVLIEASGLASPGPIAQTLSIVPALASAFQLNAIVTLAHAAELPGQLEQFPEAVEQIGYGDLVILNHVDRVDQAGQERALQEIARINPSAQILTSQRAEFDLACIDAAGDEPGPRDFDAPHGSHSHGLGVTSVALRSEQPMDIHKLKMWIQFLAARPDGQILRIKGVIACAGIPQPFVVQGVYQWLEVGPGEGPPPEVSELVIIGRDFDGEELQRGWEICRAS